MWFRTLQTNFSAILSEIHTFSFKKIHLKMASAKWRRFVSTSMCYWPWLRQWLRADSRQVITWTNYWPLKPSLQWRHNERDGVSNHDRRDCLLNRNRLFGYRSALTFLKGIHRWPVDSPHKGPVTRKMFPFDDVIMIMFRKTTMK